MATCLNTPKFSEALSRLTPELFSLEEAFDDAMAVMALPIKYRKWLGVLFAETNEPWHARKYLDMDEFNEWLIENEQTKTNVIEINKMANY